MSIFAQTILWLNLATIIISSIFYLLLIYNQKNSGYKRIARSTYFSFAGFSTIASIILMYLFLVHDFRFRYVIEYSSIDLQLKYLISSFWAGQEGSFLLWVLLGAWLGVAVLFTARQNESHVMILYNLPHIFLSILLLKQSPFETVAHAPADGGGLNMLLQDPWMVIHPPIVFLGYAAYTIPFALGMASLWKREYKDWLQLALPWTIFAFVTLGAGIIIGGVWSYKVLGWGGYWGWDPVENASLLPWLTGTALVHSMILQRSTNRLAKTNYFLASLSFILIIYSTFLTRSGVLANFSVHSFVDLGITGWLVFYIFAFIAIAGYLIVSRSKEIPVPKNVKNKEISILSLEFGLITAVFLLCLSAILTGLGTSAPLITRLAEKASKVSNQFYVNVNLPIAILIGLFLSYIPVLKWGKNSPQNIFPKIIVGIITAVITAIISIINGFPGKLVFLMVLFAGFATGINLELVFRTMRKNFASGSASLIHLGVGLMFIGFVASNAYDKSERISLPQNSPKEAMGYKLKFLQPQVKHEGKGTRYLLPTEVQKDNKIVIGQPDIYVTQKARGEDQRFHHPYIQRGWWSDLYISPEGYDPGMKQQMDTKHLIITKEETIQYKDYQIKFEQYDLSGMSSGSDQHSIQVGADLKVSYKGQKAVALKPIYVVNDPKNPLGRVKLPGEKEAFLTLVGMDASKKNISLHYEGPTIDEAKEEPVENTGTLFVEVSKKPGMSVLWLGVTFILLGGVLSIYRRLPKNIN